MLGVNAGFSRAASGAGTAGTGTGFAVTVCAIGARFAVTGGGAGVVALGGRGGADLRRRFPPEVWA